MAYSLDAEKPDRIPQETWDRLKEKFDEIYTDEDDTDDGG